MSKGTHGMTLLRAAHQTLEARVDLAEAVIGSILSSPSASATAREWVHRVSSAFIEVNRSQIELIGTAMRARETWGPGTPQLLQESVNKWDTTEAKLVELVNGFKVVGAGPEHRALWEQLSEAFSNEVAAGREFIRVSLDALQITTNEVLRIRLGGKPRPPSEGSE
jgi:hypothetical protein